MLRIQIQRLKKDEGDSLMRRRGLGFGELGTAC